MAHIVTEPCIKCKYTDCVTVCPVDCFHEDAEMLVIDPEVCIDCGACIPECPVQAIYADSDLPEKYKSFTAQNAAKSKELPVITQKKPPLAEPKK
jgi:ferredoxin